MVMIARLFVVFLLTGVLIVGLVIALRKLIIARILVVSLLTGVLVVGLLLIRGKPGPHPWDIPAIFFLGTVGAVIGAIAAATQEIVSAQQRKPSNWVDTE